MTELYKEIKAYEPQCYSVTSYYTLLYATIISPIYYKGTSGRKSFYYRGYGDTEIEALENLEVHKKMNIVCSGDTYIAPDFFYLNTTGGNITAHDILEYREILTEGLYEIVVDTGSKFLRRIKFGPDGSMHISRKDRS